MTMAPVSEGHLAATQRRDVSRFRVCRGVLAARMRDVASSQPATDGAAVGFVSAALKHRERELSRSGELELLLGHVVAGSKLSGSSEKLAHGYVCLLSSGTVTTTVSHIGRSESTAYNTGSERDK